MSDIPDVTAMTAQEIDAELKRLDLLPPAELDRFVTLIRCITRLEARLAAAEKVIETVRDYRKCWIDYDSDIGSKPDWDCDGFDEQAAERLAAYDAAKAKETA